MTQLQFLIRTSGALALAALLGACGGSGGSPDGGSGGATAPETSFLSALDAQSQIISGAKTGAETARTDAKTALEGALEVSGAFAATFAAPLTRGQSWVAMQNAQAILDASDAIDSEIEKIEEYLEKARTARTALMDLDTEGDPDQQLFKDNEIDRVNRIIMEIEGYLEAAIGVRDGMDGSDNIKALVASVLGPDEDNPLTPAERADLVAAKVDSALTVPGGHDQFANYNTDQLRAGERTEVFGYRTTRTTEHMTFDEIFGDELVDLAFGRRTVSGISLEGASTDPDDTGTPLFPDTFTISQLDTPLETGYEYPHLGLSGHAVCRPPGAVDGSCDSRGGVLGGNWYFIPDHVVDNAGGSQYFKMNSDGTYSEVVTIEYGSLLDEWNDDVHLFRRVGPHHGVGANTAVSSTNPSTTTTMFNFLQDNGQTVVTEYSGTGTGISVLYTYDEYDRARTITSGHFEADVALTATFGAADNNANGDSYMEGAIRNFRGDPESNPDGVGVDPTWALTMGRANLILGGDSTQTMSGEFTEGQRPDALDATSGVGFTAFGTAVPGSASVRPEGFFGAFNAHFVNGRAAGVYAVTEE